MRILLITPAPLHHLNGNSATAQRWKALFRSFGHDVAVEQHYQGEEVDLLVALHSWRSAEAIQAFSNKHPQKPIIVVLTGTDIYRFIHSDPTTVLKSMDAASVLVGLNDRADIVIPKMYQNKFQFIGQSATFSRLRKKSSNTFRVCIAGHLRDEKDSLRVAYAVRNLPSKSRIKIYHYGKAHNDLWETRVRRESLRNRRYCWYGEVNRSYLNYQMSQADVLVHPSLMEGGANVISEALAIGLPIIASDIDGNIGLLGENYPGYFQVGNTQELREILIDLENNDYHLAQISLACNKRKSLFNYDNERKKWEKLINQFK